MDPNFVERVVCDAEAIAEVGVNLGRFKDPGPLLDAIAAVRSAQKEGNVLPGQIATLQSAMNAAVPALAPITLNDLRTGWRPFGRAAISGSRVSIMVGACICLLLLTGSYTLLYDRMVAHLTMMQEFQNSRVPDAVLKLYQFVKASEGQDLTDFSKNSVIKEKLLDQVAVVYQTDNKFKSYWEITKYLDTDVNPVQILSYFINSVKVAIFNFFDKKLYRYSEASIEKDKYSIDNYVNFEKLTDSVKDKVYSDLKKSAYLECLDVPTDASNSKKIQSYCSMLGDLEAMEGIKVALNISYDYKNAQYFTTAIFKRQGDMIRLGNWILPALYGTLGAVVFYLRRFLDPNYPNPSNASLLFRIVLGGFAGIVVVWIWAPAPSNFGQMTFASIPSFGLAFLVGFSTDIFFQMLDRMVAKAQETLGK